jgi:aldehyde dehydrogenase (NAD+)
MENVTLNKEPGMPPPDQMPATTPAGQGPDAGPPSTAGGRLLVDGRLVEAPRTFPSVNPATGSVVGHAPDAGVPEAIDAVAAARRAFDGTDWSRNVDLRVHCLEQLHDALTKHREELREPTIGEVGAPRLLTHGPQLDDPIEIVRFYTDMLRRYSFTDDLGDVEAYGQRHHRWVEKEAAGVVAAIIAYNFPTELALAKLAPALAAGCTVVLKGAPDTPLITLALAELIARDTDILAGVVNVLTSTEVAVGEALTTHPDVDMVSFTGSTPVGRANMAAASGTLKRVFLELGGKSAMIVLDDAGFAAAATFAAFTICSHSGQGCALTSRLLVPRSNHDDPASEIAQEEVFGPVLAVIPFDDDDDAVRIANDTIYGLSGAVHGRDEKRAVAVARRIRSGSFSINGGSYFAADTPFGGFKQSGIGREMGVAGLEEFLERKTLAVVA